jgi:DNA-binding FadR family transcriptional regulator
LAAERRGQELEGQVPDAKTVAVDNDATYFNATKGFHGTVASMSGNPVLNLMCMSLEDIFQDQVSGLLFPKSRRREVLEVHQDIATAISEGRADDAEKLMRQHMQDYAEYVRKRKGPLMDEVVDWK